MIEAYGADSIRWFILSDSPPEKDVQWSSQGVNAAYKFLQKLYNLTHTIIVRKENGFDSDKEKKINIEFNNYIFKITNLINNFQLNVVVANVYSVYGLLSKSVDEKISNNCLKKNLTNLMKVIIPFVPHLAHECLEKLNEKNFNTWPKIDDTLKLNEKVKIAIQINGKTRDVVEIKKDLDEEAVIKECKRIKKINDHLDKNEIKKIIFVQNKIINFLTKNEK